jgi:hypothetical protein
MHRPIIVLEPNPIGGPSACGQLAQKIFRGIDNANIFQLRPYSVNDSNTSMTGTAYELTKLNTSNSDPKIFLKADALLEYIQQMQPQSIYIRLYRGVEFLEIACKITVAVSNAQIITHYMDKLSFDGIKNSLIIYINRMTDFLIHKSDYTVLIHECAQSWFKAKYNKEGLVLGNFIEDGKIVRPDLEKLFSKKMYNISYFGAMDPKKILRGLQLLIEQVAQRDWIQLSIYTNSHSTNYQVINFISKYTSNIKIITDNVPDKEYSERICKSDIVVMAYNYDELSAEFLEHSIANKFVDYIALGKPIIGVGNNKITALSLASKSRGAICFDTEIKLQEAFEDKKFFDSLLCRYLDSEKYWQFIKSFNDKKYSQYKVFIDIIQAEKVTSKPKTEKIFDPSISLDMLKLKLLIRRKFWDKKLDQQSLATSLAAYNLK